MVEFAAGRLQAHIGKTIDALYRALARNRITRFPWAVIQTVSDAHGALLSGSMAYYTFLSLLPLLMIAGFALGTLSQGNPAAQEALIRGVERLFPGIGGRDLLDQLIRSRVAFGVFGLLAVSYARQWVRRSIDGRSQPAVGPQRRTQLTTAMPSSP